jgi:hypothetical protein
MLGLGLGLNKSTIQRFEQLAKSAGCVLYYDARKDLITANGVTPDRSGKGNDITWANFAGTSASGLVYENGKVFRRLDGADDFGSMVNTESIDITSAPLAVFATLNVASGNSKWMFSKNVSASSDNQYGLFLSSTTNGYFCYLEGAQRGNSVGFSYDVWHNIGFIWDGTTIKYFMNQVNGGVNGSYAGTLTSRANVNIGTRGGGITYYAGKIATLSIYSGAKATEANILKAEKAISKAYIGA